MPNTYDATVIGAGSGGMGRAAQLAKVGMMKSMRLCRRLRRDR